MISIVVPLRNEETNIIQLVEFLKQAPPMEKEVFFIDGNSTDETVALIRENAGPLDYHIIENQNQTVPFGLNLAIPMVKFDLIVRLDGHTQYEHDYLTKIMDAFSRTEADIVGGPMRIGDGTSFQKLVGLATSSNFGIGNSSFHFENYEGEAESVYLGAWRRKVFDSIGYFDESLKRNQDDEFHYRARSKGFRIFQDPKIKSWYFPRKGFKSLFRQYFQYGLYKPRVLKKIPGALRIRHLVPLFFFLYTLSIPFALPFFPVYLVPLLLYFFIGLFQSIRMAGFGKSMFLLTLIFFTIHMAYGCGFFLGSFSMISKS